MSQINRIPDLEYNPLIDTDSYKPSHYLLYPKDMTYMQSHLLARGGEFQDSTLFGVQYILHKYLSVPFTRDQVLKADKFWTAHGEPFNKEGALDIVDRLGGYWPVSIKSIPEGLVVPVGNALMTVESTDDKHAWCVSYIEDIIERLWYGSTIAIQSREFAKVQKVFLDKSSDTPDADRAFKVHDFGARGVASYEQAQIGGAAHQLSFMGTDTAVGIELLQHYYSAGEMPSFSIPASEHSTVCTWTRDKEFDFYRHFVKTYLTDRQLPPGVPKLAACVSDTYNIFEAVRFWCSDEMRAILKASGGTLVIRPDSGEPVEILTRIFTLMLALLGDEVTTNSKGYKVLPPYLRVIQGDGIDKVMMTKILKKLVDDQQWSATNIAFGSGGGLLQKVNRDTQKFAFKCCAIKRGGEVVEVFKDPITDQGKRSKSGRLDLVRWPDSGLYETIKLPDMLPYGHPYSALKTVFRNGQILEHTTLAEIRERIAL